MYKYCFIIAISMVALNACEFVDGVTIEDSEVSKLFATAEDLYSNDESVRSKVEDLYTQYLCLLANRDTFSGKPVNDGGIIAILESLISPKK